MCNSPIPDIVAVSQAALIVAVKAQQQLAAAFKASEKPQATSSILLQKDYNEIDDASRPSDALVLCAGNVQSGPHHKPNKSGSMTQGA